MGLTYLKNIDKMQISNQGKVEVLDINLEYVPNKPTSRLSLSYFELEKDFGFFIQFISFQLGDFILQTRVDDSEYVSMSIKKKEFMLIQDSLCHVIDNVDTMAEIKLGQHTIQIVNIKNTIGMQVGKMRYRIPKESVINLRKFSVEIFD